MSLWRLVSCLPLLLPGLGFAQAPGEWTPYTPPAEETATPPPLVPAPPLEQPPPARPRQEPPRGEIIPRDLSERRAASRQTALRLIISPWSGAITGMAGLIVGSVPTALIALPFCVRTEGFERDPACAIAVGAGLSVSYSVGVTMGVMLVGKLLGGKGDNLLTFLGALAGAAAGSGIGIASGNAEALILGLAFGPIIGAAAVYEFTHALTSQPGGPGLQARSGLRVMPVAGLTPRGGLLAGLAGRF